MCLLLSTTSERGKALLLLLRCSEYLEGSVALWQLNDEGNSMPSIQQDINFVTVWGSVEVDVDHIPRPTLSYPSPRSALLALHAILRRSSLFVPTA